MDVLTPSRYISQSKNQYGRKWAQVGQVDGSIVEVGFDYGGAFNFLNMMFEVYNATIIK